MTRIGRRAFLARCVALTALGAGGVGSVFGADALNAETLKAMLRAATDEEAAFVDDVVQKVDDGELPRNILHAAYRYAVKKPKTRRMLYFRICLIKLSQQAGLKLQFLSF